MEFQVRGCKIEVTFLFLAVLAFSLLTDRSGFAGPGILAAAFHECGHLAALRVQGTVPRRISLMPFGADLVDQDRGRRSYLRDAAVSAAGPAVNLAACALLFPLSRFGGQTFLFRLAAANLALACFNLLPAEALDGGQALYSLLCRRFQEKTAADAVRILSFFVLLPLAALGFLTVFRSPYQYSLLLAVGYLIFLLVLKKGRYF